ncbi:MAG: Uma2 family endonuclease [Chloroflexota bacterium]|nr:Uma2 family endonuclease [Chloroflexota bacterium]
MTTATPTAMIQMVFDGSLTPIDLEVLQGLWSDEQYLRLTDATNWLVEFTDGRIEILPMPTYKHQAMVIALLLRLHEVVVPLGGTVIFAALRLQIRPGKYREPDLLVLRDCNDPRREDRLWYGADLVMEVVSSDNPERDTQEKRRDYAEGGVPEYWIVNPQDATITVLELVGDSYVEHGVFRRGDTADSVVLSGFAVAVDTVLDAD